MSVTQKTINFVLSREAQRGRSRQVQRSFPLSKVDYIDFFQSEKEAELLKQKSPFNRLVLQKIWNAKGGYLDQPRSNAGQIGLLYALALKSEDSVYFWTQAMELYTLIEDKAWDEAVRDKARLGKIRVLVLQGKIAGAIHSAENIIVENTSGSMIVEANLLLAEIKFRQLRELQKENPVWYEDDELKPVRDQLYHQALDHYLTPYLFHGTREDAAVRGLMGSAALYDFVEDWKRSKEVLQDVLQIYALSPMGAQAKRKLEVINAAKANLNNEK
ncbi:MAG: hypothetical protein QM496_05890 [Verrucomicrobiota bacterium]